MPPLKLVPLGRPPHRPPILHPSLPPRFPSRYTSTPSSSADSRCSAPLSGAIGRDLLGDVHTHPSRRPPRMARRPDVLLPRIDHSSLPSSDFSVFSSFPPFSLSAHPSLSLPPHALLLACAAQLRITAACCFDAAAPRCMWVPPIVVLRSLRHPTLYLFATSICCCSFLLTYFAHC